MATRPRPVIPVELVRTYLISATWLPGQRWKQFLPANWKGMNYPFFFFSFFRFHTLLILPTLSSQMRCQNSDQCFTRDVLFLWRCGETAGLSGARWRTGVLRQKKKEKSFGHGPACLWWHFLTAWYTACPRRGQPDLAALKGSYAWSPVDGFGQ